LPDRFLVVVVVVVVQFDTLWNISEFLVQSSLPLLSTISRRILSSYDSLQLLILSSFGDSFYYFIFVFYLLSI
jgi:hypothetical protein